MTIMKNHVKVLFRLTQDADGYPPVAVEGIWATQESADTFTLDNVPFFTREATLGDTVSAKEEGHNLWFAGMSIRSRNSLLRVVLFDAFRVQELRQRLTDLGCSTEWDQSHKLVAVNVPETARLTAVQSYLQAEAARGWLDYEEPILRQ